MLETRICPVDATDWNGSTALHHAASRGFYEAVGLLVHIADAPINVKNLHGETPLHQAVEGGFSDIVEVKLNNFKF